MQASRKSEKWVFFIYFQFREIRLLFSAGGQMKRAMNTIWFSLWTPIFSPMISGFSKSAAIRFPKLKSTNYWPCPRSPPCPSFLHTPTRRSISIISSCPHWPCRATPLSTFFPKTHPQPDHSGDDMNYKSQMAHGILACFSFPRASYLIQCEVLNLTRAKKTHNSSLLTLPVPLSLPVTVCFQQPQTHCSVSWYGRRFFSLLEGAQLSHLLVGVLVWISLLEHTLSDMIFFYILLLNRSFYFPYSVVAIGHHFRRIAHSARFLPSSGWRLHTRLSFLSGTMFLALLLVPDVWVLKWRDTERNESEFYFLDSRAVFILFRVNTFRFEPRWSFQPTWKS